jgi:hypothetical protein
MARAPSVRAGLAPARDAPALPEEDSAADAKYKASRKSPDEGARFCASWARGSAPLGPVSQQPHQNSFCRQRHLTLLDEKRSIAPVNSAFQSPIKVNGPRVSKVWNSDGKFLVGDSDCFGLNFSRMFRILVFQAPDGRLRTNVSKEDAIVGVANFDVEPCFSRIIAHGS